MKLLKSIIHHADNVQNKFLVPKKIVNNPHELKPSSSVLSIDSVSSIFSSNDAAIAEINDKCYQRWHQVLQEGLVPMSVRALNLLEDSAATGGEATNDEEDSYFATLAGMDEDIQVMAILARAAALLDVPACLDAGIQKNAPEYEEDGMKQINAMMKCTAMLLFQIVLATLEEAEKKSSSEASRRVAGYDGRIRHVIKSACVDVLSRAIIDSAEAFREQKTQTDIDDTVSFSGVHDVDEYSPWNIASIVSILDQTDLGKDAIFGVTEDKPSSRIYLASKKMRQEYIDENQTLKRKNSRSKRDKKISTTAEIASSETSPSLEVHSEQPKNPVTPSLEIIPCKEETSADIVGNHCNQRNDEQGEERHKPDEDVEDGDEHDEAARRHFNAVFLATRKFELIERLVAIDIVRFLVIKEREIKLLKKELEEKKKKSHSLSSRFRTDKDDCHGSTNNKSGTADLVEIHSEEVSNDEDEKINNSIFSPFKVQQLKRGAKIAGAGLALGTIFAITGGLAAPALASAIGGIAALSGAGAAHSAALVAVLATFKAGAALFGVGGGGLSAYKMKKRTAGLSDFSIRRENIEQYMYLGAPEEKMKKGIEAMLPQLHTTVCVSGWLRENDIADFQLAWGVQPTCKYVKVDNDRRLRQLKRFYSIYNPPLVHDCEAFMQTLQKRLKKDFSWER
jgi:hypothetical protein